MKYIRTSDGAIYEMVNDNTIVFCGQEIKVTLTDSNHRIADSIEELCDEFVVIQKDSKPYRPSLIYGVDIKKFYIENKHNNCEVYGAIWTQLGLFYQAKMNEKGEWELL